MAVTLFNLFWVYPLPPRDDIETMVAQDTFTQGVSATLNTLDNAPKGIPAAILFPALMTPDVIKKNDHWVHILLATKAQFDEPYLRNRVNWQLKLTKGLDPKFTYQPAPLFPKGGTTNKMSIHFTYQLNTERLQTGNRDGGRFWGHLDPTAAQMYRDNGFTTIYSISIHPDMLDSVDVAHKQRYLAHVKENKNTRSWVVAPEKRRNNNHQNWIIQEKIKNTNIDGDGLYGFPVAANEVKIGKADEKNPVLAYHPLFVYDNLDYLNFGHMGDIHISSRQQFMYASPAAVIEHDDFNGEYLGDRVNICSQRTKELYNAFAADGNVNAVIIGGDLIDYLPNTYTKDFQAKKASYSIRQIWDLLSIDNRATNYQNNVDFLTNYSLVVDFYKKASPKPVFAVTGNHDSYYHAFGISPRVMGSMTNEGIPADHNLTVYEANLIFGPTWSKLTKLGTPYNSDHTWWFYAMFTPFKDFSLQLPKQRLAALGWGDDEDLIDKNIFKGQGGGHLPRANKCIDDDQYNLVKDVVDNRGTKKVILTTHFTFVSYAESISNQDALANGWDGKVFISEKYATRDNGTFEMHRAELYRDIIHNDKAIQLILTGHSHRRGMYELDGISDNWVMADYVTTMFHDYDKYNPRDTGTQIVLSDSGGPIPRYNAKGEFDGWGSEKPGGTKVAFKANGDFDAIDVVATTCVPRFVVALDYWDIITNKVIKNFKSDDFLIANEDNVEISFNLELNDKFMTDLYPVKIDSVRLYHVRYKRGVWTKNKIAMTKGNTDYVWKIGNGQDNTNPLNVKTYKQVLRDLVADNKRSSYMAIQFSPNPAANSNDQTDFKNRYDFTDPWTFEVKVEWEYTNRPRPTRKRYKLTRCHRQKPDFDRRTKFPNY